MVDYERSTVEITNPNFQNSKQNLEIEIENQNNFTPQNKWFWGVDWVHQFSKNLRIAGTYINLKEQTTQQKVSFKELPIHNQMFGFSIQYQKTLNFLKNWKFLNSKVPSNFSLRNDFAYLKPNVSENNYQEQATYIDDFENAQTSFDLSGFRTWKLASKPLNFKDENGVFQNLGSENFNDLNYGTKRGKLAWYKIDLSFYHPVLKPENIDNNELSRIEVSPILQNELFPNQSISNENENAYLQTFDLAYCPQEKGSYNYEKQTDLEGNLKNPEENWAGITRALPITNFEKHNISYLEFWLQNPYNHYSIEEREGGKNENLSQNGKLYFNLGNISEDILKDNLKQFENGLPP